MIDTFGTLQRMDLQHVIVEVAHQFVDRGALPGGFAEDRVGARHRLEAAEKGDAEAV